MILKKLNTNKLVLFVVASLISLFAGLIMFNGSAEAAPAKCYVDLGNFRVAPSTETCPAPSDRVVYVDTSGNSIQGAPAENECYSKTTSGSGSFTSTRYARQDCNGLENLRVNALREACTNNGGTIEFDPNSRPVPYEAFCKCPNNQIFSNGQCNRNQSGDPTGPVTEPQYVESDCQGNDLNPDNCGILRYLVIFINVLSAAVGLVVVGSIIYGGIQYSASSGDPSSVSAAKDRIRNSIIALLFFLFAYSILNWLVPGGVL